MSAFLCSANHLSLIANAAAALDDAPAQDEVFAMLVAENVRSLQARYGDVDEEISLTRRNASATDIVSEALAARPQNSPWGFKGDVTVRVLATQLVKACDCYDYQACETRDYEKSDAAAIVARVRNAAVKLGGHTTGTKLYDQMLWGIY